MQQRRRITGQIKHIWVGLVLLLVGVFALSSQTVWAGDINDAEAGVISAASGTFEYNGKTYRTYSSYINDLYAYLSRDNVNLSPGQAKKAINYMYSHVGTGLQRGYIYEVGGKNDPNVTTEKKTESTQSTETTQATQTTRTSEGRSQSGTDQTDATEGTEATEATETTESASVTEQITEGSSSGRSSERRSETTEEGQEGSTKSEAEETSEVEEIFSKIEENQADREAINQRVKPEDADVKAEIREETIVIDTGDGDPIELDSTKQIVPPMWPRILVIVAAVTLAVTVLMCLILILKKCMRFGKSDRKKPMPGHRRRRRIRKLCRRVLTVTTAVSVAGVFLLMALFVIVFNNSRILQSVQSSGYYRHAYIEYLAESGRGEDGKITEAPTEETSDGSTEASAPKNDTEAATDELSDGGSNAKVLSYDDFVIREKQATEQLLQGNRNVTYQQSNVAPYVLRLNEDLQFAMILGMILFGISLVLGCVFTIFMDLRRDRGIRMIAVSELIGTAFAGILTILLLVWNPAKHLFIEPDYLYVFFKNHVDWMIRVLSVITVFGLVIGMSLIGVYFGKRKEKID